jgi:ParB-like chromosome segregation protein Spo0J
MPYPKNARKWTAAAVEKVATSIREYGWRQPVVVDVNDVIIIGHLRLEAARTLGLIEVPAHVASELSPEQVKGLRLMDNRSHEEAQCDLSLLGPEIADLSALSFDLSLIGFNDPELDAMCGILLPLTQPSRRCRCQRLRLRRSGICGS